MENYYSESFCSECFKKKLILPIDGNFDAFCVECNDDVRVHTIEFSRDDLIVVVYNTSDIRYQLFKATFNEGGSITLNTFKETRNYTRMDQLLQLLGLEGCINS